MHLLVTCYCLKNENWKEGTRDQHVALLSSQDKLSTARIAIFVYRERASIFRAHKRFHANALIFCLDIEFCFHATQLGQSRFIFKLVFDFRLQWWLNRVCVRARAVPQKKKCGSDFHYLYNALTSIGIAKREVSVSMIICTMSTSEISSFFVVVLKLKFHT